MNQQQVKEYLLELDREVPDFTITFSGKRSKKVDGLYKADSREIIIHTENFENDNQLMYTAIHEFAHHIQFSRSAKPVSSRAHTNHFWNILHNLLFDAEKKGLYENIFKKDSRFIALTKKIKDNYLSANGSLMKDFGKLLFEAYELCIQSHANFDDYVDRELGLHRSSAKSMIKVNNLDIRPEIGYDNMKIVASIKDDGERDDAERAFMRGDSPDMVKAKYKVKNDNEDLDPLEYLLLEREKLEKSVENLIMKISKLDNKINELKTEKKHKKEEKQLQEVL